MAHITSTRLAKGSIEGTVATARAPTARTAAPSATTVKNQHAPLAGCLHQRQAAAVLALIHLDDIAGRARAVRLPNGSRPFPKSILLRSRSQREALPDDQAAASKVSRRFILAATSLA
jgi:hypothetical protein